MKPALRPVWATVDLDAVRSNVAALQSCVGSASVLAVVKADAYGHGAVPIAAAALEAGATHLGVALVEEGMTLRAAGVEAPILLLSEPARDAFDAVVEHRLTPTVYSVAAAEALIASVRRHDQRAFPAHLKIDTGMHRVGCDPDNALAIAEVIVGASELHFEGAFTHFAVADEADNHYNEVQLERFNRVVDRMRDARLAPTMLHAANTAAAIGIEGARYDIVRCGIGLYGYPPARWMADRIALTPVLSVHAAISFVKRVPAHESLSYGLRYTLQRESTIATIPIGYADCVPRRLGETGGEVLIHGHRLPIAGTVTMDQILVDVGDLPVNVGDDVVLIGTQGTESITAQDWADRVGTIAYEIVCGIGPRVPRKYLGARS